MAYKKTWLSCLLWAAFSALTAALLANDTILFWKKNINDAPGMEAAAAVFAVFALIAGCYFLIRMIVHKIKDKCKISRRTMFLWELAITLCIFAAGLLYRFHMLLQSSLEIIEVTPFYRDATLKAGESVPYMEHGMSYLYTLCLSFVLSFLGNKVIAGVLMQIVLQLLTMLLGFFAVRKTVGKLPACAVMLMLAFSPAYAEQIFIMTPEVMYLFLYVSGLFIVGSYLKNYCDAQFNIPLAVNGAVICGIAIGVFIYLDAFSLTLVAFMACLFIADRTKVDDKRFTSTLFSGLMFFLTVVVGGLVLTGGFALDAYINSDTLAEMAGVWLSPYQKEMNLALLTDYRFFIAGDFQAERFVLVLFAALLIFAFWSRKKIQNVSPWFLLAILLNSPLMSIGVLEYNVCNLFVWSVLAGAGLQLSLTLEKKAQETPPTEIITVPAATEASLVAEVAAIAAAAETAPRYIENPLPLPKKHEKRVMDYQYEVPEDKMKFDIEIGENDDFDI